MGTAGDTWTWEREELPTRADCSCCQALSDRVMELEDIASPLSAGFAMVRDRFKLTVREASLLMALLRYDRTLSKDELMTLSYPVETQRPELKIVDVFICRLRKKLPPDIRIRTDWGMGYHLDSAARRALQAIANGGGEQSDGGAQGGKDVDTIIDFRRIQAAGASLNIPALAAAKAADESKPKASFVWVGSRLEAVAIKIVQQTATDILAG